MGVSNISLHSLPTMLDKVISFAPIIKHNLEKVVREGRSIVLTPCICSFCGPSSLRKFHESFNQFLRSQQQPGQQLDARAPRTGSCDARAGRRRESPAKAVWRLGSDFSVWLGAWGCDSSSLGYALFSAALLR